MTQPNWDHIEDPILRKVLGGETASANDYEHAVYVSESHNPYLGDNTPREGEMGEIWEKAETAVYEGNYPETVALLQRFWGM
jgi:hypothetical protein